jgi:thymidine phosphorylase
VVPVTAASRRRVPGIDALALGLSAWRWARAARAPIRPSTPLVGIVLHKGVGDKVAPGDVLCELHLAAGQDEKALSERALAAFHVGSASAQPAPLVIDVIRK